MLSTLIRWSGVYRFYERYLRSQLRKEEFPTHVGIILDGNRRWAHGRMFPRGVGHRMGADKAEEVLEWCHELGIQTLTLYVLSTENLMRSEAEVKELIELIEGRLSRLLRDERLWRYKVRVKALGKPDLLPESTQKVLKEIEEATMLHNGHFLNIAIAYGGRLEIIDALKRIAGEVREGKIALNDIGQEVVERHLYTSHLPNPEPDLIIRTSREERLSGFLLWQSAYSEFVFLDVYWPEFRKIDLMRAIRTYQKRSRRYGK